MKNKTLKAALAFLTASAAVVGIAAGPTSAASVDGQTYSYPIETNGGSDADITGNANATVDGTNVDVVAFADNIDVDAVVMHFHTGPTCDSAGAIVLGVDGDPVDVIDGSFVLEETYPLGTVDFDNVYFNVHEAGNLGNVLGCGELDFTEGDDPQITAPVNREAFTIESQSMNGSNVLTSGSATLTGNRLSINIGLLGPDLLNEQNIVVTLQGNSTCDNGSFALRTADMLYALTSSGTTDPISAGVTFQQIFNRSAYQQATDIQSVDIGVELFLTPAQAANVDDYAIVVHGMESLNSEAQMLGGNSGFGNLSEQVGTVSNCSQLVVDAVNTGTLNGNYYNLTFTEQNDSGISGVGFLQNTTQGTAGSLGVVASLDVGNTDAYKTILGAETTCSDTLTELTGTNPELLTGDGGKLGGDAGKIRGFVSNQADFGGPVATVVNDGDFVVYLTAATATTPLACAQLSPARVYGDAPTTPAPPTAFDGTVAEASTIAEIQAASDYRSAADNKGTDQEIMRLYTAFFNREPDAAGVKYWIAVSKGEAGPAESRRVYSTLEIAQFFVPQKEFQNTFASVANDAFVDTVYQNVLKREGETVGVAYWNDILNGTNNSGRNAELKKGTRADVVFFVAVNQEFVNRLPYAPITSA